MKFSSKMRILRGPSALRVKMGVSQEVFGQYLDIAASTVSMVELGNRPFPKKALQRLAELEIAWANREKGAGVPAKEPNRALPAQQQFIRDTKQNIRKLDLSRAKYELDRMTGQYNEVMESFAYIELAKQIHGQEEGSQQKAALERAELSLIGVLRSCNMEQQSKIRGRIARLEIIIAAHEPVVMVIDAATEAVDAPALRRADDRLNPIQVIWAEESELVLPESQPLSVRVKEEMEAAA